MRCLFIILKLICSFRPSKVEAIINEVLRDILEGKNFTPEHGKQWSNDIVAEIRQRCKSLFSVVFYFLSFKSSSL